MIPSWRRIQLQNFTSWEKLALFLDWPEELRHQVLKKSSFPLNLPLRLAQKAQKKSLEDPILKQFLPSFEEEKIDPGFSIDPVQDATFRKHRSRILHKYQGRALLLASSACAMHCRYCFRKNFDYERGNQDFSTELNLLQGDSSLKEIILSGGDPLSLSDETLGHLLKGLEAISHIKRIRFHTRFPIGIPERIDDSFIELLSSIQKQIVFIVHVNHPQELDEDIFRALKRLQKQGIPVLSQTVLLRGINNSKDTLKQLFENLSDEGVLPYYLHQFDPIQGGSHFHVPEEIGKQLMKELSTCISGYSLPRYAKEIPGLPSKTLISFF